MSGHSPAPWTFRPNPCECPDCTAAFWIDSAPRSADERIGVPIGEVRDLGKASEANARLIAAAPELLDAVATLKVYLHDALFHANYPERTMPAATFEAASAAVEEAGRLLAKARGGA